MFGAGFEDLGRNGFERLCSMSGEGHQSHIDFRTYKSPEIFIMKIKAIIAAGSDV